MAKPALLFALAIILRIGATRAKSCGPAFRDKCACGNVRYEYEDRMQYVVNCTDTRFKDASMLAHLPAETQVLIFTGNNISELPWNVFGSLTNYTRLRVVDMSNNRIREIRGKSYHHVANVERLILDHNELSIASSDHRNHPRIFSNFVSLRELHLTDAFEDNSPEALAGDLHNIFVESNLTRLIKLHLEQNEITGFLDRKVFCDLPGLMDLHLGDNLLRGVDFDLLCLPNLRFLDLERNHIAALSERELASLDSLPARNQSLVVDLMGNPFSCDDCATRSLYAWLQRTRVQVRNKETLRCHRGDPLAATQCLAKPGPSPDHGAVSSVLAVLLAVLACLLLAVGYVNRAAIRRHFAPLINTVSQKVQYTSIGKQEEQEMNV